MALDFPRFGGMLPRYPSRTLKASYADYALDVDLSSGTLRPWREDRLLQTAGANALTLMVEDCCVAAEPTCVDISRQTLPCTRYYRAKDGKAEVADSLCGPWRCLGFPCLMGAPVVSFTATTQTPEKVTRRQFFYTLVNGDGEESAASPLSTPTIQDWDNPAMISGFDAVDECYGVQFIRIYSTGPDAGSSNSPEGSIDSFFQVAEIRAGASSFLWSPTPFDYGKLYDTQNHDAPPANVKAIQSWNSNQVGLLADGLLYLSFPDRRYAFPHNAAMRFADDPITWLATESFGYILTCGRPEVVDLRQDCKNGRCKSATTIQRKLPLMGIKSVARYQDAVIYASTDGLIMLAGTQASTLTADLFDAEQWRRLNPANMRGVVHNGYYFVSSGLGYSLRIKLPNNLHDRLEGDALSYLSIDPTAWYETSEGRLLFANATGIHEWNAGSERKSMVWRSVPIAVQSARLGAAKIEHECGDSAGLKINKLVGTSCDPRTVLSRQVDDNRGFTLPAYVKSNLFQFELTGKSEVFRAQFGLDMDDLARTGR